MLVDVLMTDLVGTLLVTTAAISCRPSFSDCLFIFLDSVTGIGEELATACMWKPLFSIPFFVDEFCMTDWRDYVWGF